MGKIRDYIENNILKYWKHLPKWAKKCVIILLVILLIITFVPFLYPKYNEWKNNIENIFDFKKQVLSDTTIYVDSILKDTIIKQNTTQPPQKTIMRIQESKTEPIKGEGIAIDFTEEEAREKALKKAKADLLNKFPKDKEQIVNRYAKIIKDTTEKTNRGVWKAYIIISVNESDIK